MSKRPFGKKNLSEEEFLKVLQSLPETDSGLDKIPIYLRIKRIIENESDLSAEKCSLSFLEMYLSIDKSEFLSEPESVSGKLCNTFKNSSPRFFLPIVFLSIAEKMYMQIGPELQANTCYFSKPDAFEHKRNIT